MIDQGKKKKTSVDFVNILGVPRVIHFNPQQKKIVGAHWLLRLLNGTKNSRPIKK